MLDKLIDILNQPFPSSNSFRSQVKESIGVGVFVFLFLFLLRPFGSHQIDTIDAFYNALVFGVLTFVVSLGYDLVLQKIFKIEFDKPTWTFWKWLLSTVGLILSISVANFLLMTLSLGYMGFDWVNFIYQIYATFLVGVFPIIFFGTINLLSNQKKFSQLAEDVRVHDSRIGTQPSVQLITEQGETEIDSSKLLYVEALQNYVTIHFENMPSVTLRATLKSIEDQLGVVGLIKSHRSYLVNPSKVVAVNGNAQGLKLSMIDSVAIVPVSRKYISVVKEAL